MMISGVLICGVMCLHTLLLKSAVFSHEHEKPGTDVCLDCTTSVIMTEGVNMAIP